MVVINVVFPVLANLSKSNRTRLVVLIIQCDKNSTLKDQFKGKYNEKDFPFFFE